jgi:RNA polymerase sigma factor (sigma-70 family)
MNEPVRAPRPDHPLMAERARLDNILDNMNVQIQKVIYGGRVPDDVERALRGGESVDDVLQKAFIALLAYDPDELRESWEALSVRIARNKAVDALRRATKGRRPRGADPDTPDDISVVSFDAGEHDLHHAGEDTSPEDTFMIAQQELVLLRLARDRLTDREKTVYFGIQFQGRTRAELADEIGLTPQGVGQMYVRIAKALDAEARSDPAFPTNRIPEGKTE